MEGGRPRRDAPVVRRVLAHAAESSMGKNQAKTEAPRPWRRNRRWPIATAVVVVAGLVVLAAAASAELTQTGDLFVRFDGGIAPRDLPRDSLSPIAVRIEGTIRTPPGKSPPPLRKIRVALNRAGRLDPRGLPICGRGRIRSATTVQALDACGPSLVGSGGITAVSSFPDQPNYLMRAEVVLFNAVVHGRSAILAHIYQHDPAPITRLVVFKIRRTGGAFGTVIEADIPESINENGYLKTIYLQLQRRFTFQGEDRSYLSASCSTPAGVPVALFPFANASMTFEDGRTLRSIMMRTCRAR